MTARRRSGIQHDLRHGALTATVASVGASLRTLASDGRDLVVPFEADEVRPAYRGATLAPWPNRVVDGRYAFGGVERQLPITEVERGHALHGLVAWSDWDAVEASSAHVRLRTTIAPSLGYPWRVQVDATFALADDGLTQTVEAVNVGDDVAPWGTAPHPYLVAGASPLDDWTLALPADDVLLVTDDRLSPTTLEPVACDPVRFDFRERRALGTVEIDHAFTGLARDADGLVRVLLDDPAHGTGVELAFGAACDWVQIHTADLPGGPAQPGHRAGLAAEPMTGAPDAFNAPRYPLDAGLVALVPGERHVASWRIAPR